MQINSNTIVDRIIKIIEKEGITKYKFCKDLGFSNGFLDKSREISTDKYEKILAYFPAVNPEWLLTSKGKMFKAIGLMSDEEVSAQDAEVAAGTVHVGSEPPPAVAKHPSYKRAMEKIQELAAEVHEGTPLITIEAAAGFGSENFSIAENDIQDKYCVPDFNGIDFMVRVKGNSMYPKYSSGDVIACRVLRESKFIEWNKPHLIATTEHGLIVKRIRKHEDGILAVSDNKDYEPFIIPHDEITGIAVIVGVIRLE